jgi:hypothetical protein
VAARSLAAQIKKKDYHFCMVFAKLPSRSTEQVVTLITLAWLDSRLQSLESLPSPFCVRRVLFEGDNHVEGSRRTGQVRLFTGEGWVRWWPVLLGVRRKINISNAKCVPDTVSRATEKMVFTRTICSLTRTIRTDTIDPRSSLYQHEHRRSFLLLKRESSVYSGVFL